MKEADSFEEAIGKYIERGTDQPKHELSTTTAALRAYRKRNPDFANVRKAFIDGEASHGKFDPLEGCIFTLKPTPGACARRDSSGRVNRACSK